MHFKKALKTISISEGEEHAICHFSKTINYLAFNDLLFLICGSLKQVCRVSQWTVDRKTNCVDLRACERDEHGRDLAQKQKNLSGS